MIKAVFIFPPATDPRAPQLGLPSLAAALRGAGIETKLVDLIIQSVLALLKPERIAESGRRVKKAGDRATGEIEQRLRCLASLSDHLAEVVGKALQTLREEQSFFDPHLFNSARNTICSVMDLHSAAARRPVSYNVLAVRYDVEGIDPQMLADLVTITTDRDANLFWEMWEKEIISELNLDRPDVVGISITNRQQLLPGLMLAHRLRELEHFVIIGGGVFTKFTSQLAKRPVFFQSSLMASLFTKARRQCLN